MKSSPQTEARILLVDDHKEIHLDFKRSLAGDQTNGALAAMEVEMFGSAPSKGMPGRRVSYRIDSATQGEQAFKMVGNAVEINDRYALAFVDMRMPPGWDGLQTIERIWSVDPEIQVVICTAYSDYSWDDIVARLGRTDKLLILRKPFDPVEVCQMADSLCEKHRLGGLARIKQVELEDLVRLRTGQLEESIRKDRLRLDLLESLVDQRTSELRYAAMHDRLTGLPNRSMICDRLTAAVTRSELDRDYKFAVMFIDLDDFKLVNDTLGHAAGDRLLMNVARCLTRTLSSATDIGDDESLTAARLGGDEFVILLENLKDHADAEVIAGRIMTAMAEPHQLEGRQVHCVASIGITTNSTAYSNVEQLLRDADIAMYRAKEEKNRFVVFMPEMHSKIVARVSLEDEIRSGLDRNEFELYYQPIVSLTDGTIAGFESLLRWNHPQRGVVLPDHFLPLAETTGLILPLGRTLLRQAAEQIVKWTAKFPHSNVPINLNLSSRQLMDPALIGDLRSILDATGADGSKLVLEITEGFLAEELAVAERLLVALREMKVRTHIDDFGVGHSSLGRLPRLPIDGIKIDRSFLTEVNGRRKYAAIINAIINLAHHMDLSVVAEGIESIDQVALLQTLDCDNGQGYYFSRPVSAEQAEVYFHENWRLNRHAA